MTASEQLHTLAWVGVFALFALAILLVLWWGARLKRHQRVDLLDSVLNVEAVLDVLARLLRRR